MSEPKFKRGDEVYVTGYDDPGRDCAEGLIIRYHGEVLNIETKEDNFGVRVTYGVTHIYPNGSLYVTAAAGATFATEREALEKCAQWWEDRAERYLKRAQHIRERS